MYQVGDKVIITNGDFWEEYEGLLVTIKAHKDSHGHFMVTCARIRKDYPKGIYVSEEGIRFPTKLEKAML